MMIILLLIPFTSSFENDTTLHEDKQRIFIDHNISGITIIPVPNYQPIKYSAPKAQRYGRYYFDYKFELDNPFPVENKKKKSSAFNQKEESTRLTFSNKKYYHPSKAEEFLNKTIGPRILKYNDIIFVKMRNPVEPPRQQYTPNTVYPYKKFLQEAIQDSVDKYNSYKQNEKQKNGR